MKTEAAVATSSRGTGTGRTYTEEDFELSRQLGIRIRERREELRVGGPTDLARMIGDERISGEYISGIERGVNAPRLTALLAIAAALKTTTSHLLGDAGGRHKDADEDRAYRDGYRAAIMDIQTSATELRRQNS